MSVRNMLIAAAVLALLGGVIYLEYRIETGEGAEEDSAKKAVALDETGPGALSGIDLVRHGETISIRKREDGWFLTSPLESRADDEKVDGLVSTLKWLEITGRLGPATAEAGLEAYGLEPPEVEILLRGAGDAVIGRIGLGAGTPVGSGRYARIEGQEGILTLSASAARFLEVDAAGLRYSKIVGLDSWEVAGLELTRGGERSALARTDGAWRITGPVDFPADATKVSSLLHDLAALRADRFAEPGASPASVGMEAPDLVLRLETEGKQSREVRFRRAGAEGGYWAVRSDMAEIFHLAEGDAKALDLDVRSLQDPRVAPLDRYAVSEIRSEDAAGTKLLVKDPQSNWRWGSADGPVIGGAAVEDLLDALDAARAAEWSPSPSRAAVSPGEAPRRRLRVTEKGREPIEVVIGAEAAGRVAVRSTASSYLYHVDAKLVRRLEEAVDAIQLEGDAPS